mgnify:FL=1
MSDYEFADSSEGLIYIIPALQSIHLNWNYCGGFTSKCNPYYLFTLIGIIVVVLLTNLTPMLFIILHLKGQGHLLTSYFGKVGLCMGILWMLLNHTTWIRHKVSNMVLNNVA